jgi:hypothetical protein
VRTGWGAADSLLARRGRELGELTLVEAREAVGAAMLRRAPTAMFLVLPVFALLLKLLHLRRGRYYVEHFVFGLHTHAFAFVLFTLMLFLGGVPGVVPAAILWLLLYLLLAMKRFYGQGWPVTLLKYGALGVMYSVVFVAGVVVSVMVALLLG